MHIFIISHWIDSRSFFLLLLFVMCVNCCWRYWEWKRKMNRLRVKENDMGKHKFRQPKQGKVNWRERMIWKKRPRVKWWRKTHGITMNTLITPLGIRAAATSIVSWFHVRFIKASNRPRNANDIWTEWHANSLSLSLSPCSHSILKIHNCSRRRRRCRCRRHRYSDVC